MANEQTALLRCLSRRDKALDRRRWCGMLLLARRGRTTLPYLTTPAFSLMLGHWKLVNRNVPMQDLCKHAALA